MTAGKTLLAIPEIAMGKPKAIQGFGMLQKLVFGRDGEGALLFNADGYVPSTVPASAVTDAECGCAPGDKKES